VTTIANYKYEIDTENAIRVWDLNNPNDDMPGNPPFFYQPTHPDSTPFADADDAKNWIETVINEWLNPPAVEETPAE
jgi:hypothetical protein